MIPHVVFTTPIEADLVETLVRDHPDFNFTYPAHLLAGPRYPAEHRYPEFESLSSDDQREWEELLASADILFDFGPARLRPQLADRPRLRWIQTSSSGVGALVERIGLAARPEPIVTTASGVHAGPIAEFVVLAMLWFLKNGPLLMQRQREHIWQRLALNELAGTTATIVGLGRVGGTIAAKCRALGVETIGFGRRPRSDAGGPGTGTYLTIESLDEWLPRADFAILCLPDTPSTAQLFDAVRLAKLPPTSVLINVGRGTAVDEPALIDALQAGRLAGAALDVVAKEPLDSGSPLWDMPQVLVTPHSISTVPAENGRIVEIFDENLTRFSEGKPLRNQLDKQAGY
ncbi:MAG: D-2-hydroxyacid dehydrogenase [Candidatus Dormiibacterota bacterium]